MKIFLEFTFVMIYTIFFLQFLAVYMNSAFVGNEKENLQNLVDALIGELGETVFTSGTLRATFYEDETPRFTRGNKVHIF